MRRRRRRGRRRGHGAEVEEYEMKDNPGKWYCDINDKIETKLKVYYKFQYSISLWCVCVWHLVWLQMANVEFALYIIAKSQYGFLWRGLLKVSPKNNFQMSVGCQCSDMIWTSTIDVIQMSKSSQKRTTKIDHQLASKRLNKS